MIRFIPDFQKTDHIILYKSVNTRLSLFCIKSDGII